MLKRYTVEGFKSFKNKTTIDLTKTNYKTLSDTNVRGNILKGVLFYGANASGKSNIIQPLKFLIYALFNPNEINFNNLVCLNSELPSYSLEYEFVIAKSEIVYTIKYNAIDSIISETLLLDGVTLLERHGSTAKVLELSDRSSFTDISNRSLFMREIYFNTRFRGNKVLQDWFGFLQSSVYIDLYKRQVLVGKDIGLGDAKTYFEKYGTEEINDFFKEFGFQYIVEYKKNITGKNIKYENDTPHIFFLRNGLDNPISLSYESLGNQNLINLMPLFFSVVKNGGMLIMDEFSSGFHNDLEKLLIKYFMKTSDHSQLFAVSHSTNLLSTSLLRPDQIYSVDFIGDSSVVNRFSNEQPREAQNLEKMYLGGVFDGIPQYKY